MHSLSLTYTSSKNFSQQSLHKLALLFTALIHGSIAFFAIYSFAPMVMKQQVINVNFVAPNTQKQQRENHSQQKIVPLPEQKNALKQEKQKQEITKIEKLSTVDQIDRKTSGRVDEKATATKSAESDPIFDATYLNNPTPNYPASAKRRGIQGKVLLEVAVKSDGHAASVKVQQSSGDEMLDQAAIDAVEQWKFVPARRFGQNVSANVIVPIEFKLL